MSKLTLTVSIYSTIQYYTFDFDAKLGDVHAYLYDICPTYHILNTVFEDKTLHLKTKKQHNMYSQNNEEAHLLAYFKDFKGVLLDIGANDGKTYSNSLKLIELGWKAVLVEPSPKCLEKIKELHGDNKNVIIAPCAISNETKKAKFNESGALIVRDLTEDNHSLVSTLVDSEKERWKSLNMDWKEFDVDVFSYNDFKKAFCSDFDFDFISIDAEGVDLIILKQIDLTKTKILCIEYNLNAGVKKEIMDYAAQFGLTNLIYSCAENLMLSR